MSHRNSMIECHIEFNDRMSHRIWKKKIWNLLDLYVCCEQFLNDAQFKKSPQMWLFTIKAFYWSGEGGILVVTICLASSLPLYYVPLSRFRSIAWGKRPHWLKFVKILKFYLSHRVIVNLIGGVHWVELCLLAWFSLLLLLVDHNPLPDDHNKEQDEDHCS